MAHFILEYSNNLSSDELNTHALFAELHQAMDASGIFPLAGLRSRAFCADQFYVANGDENMAYIHLNFRIGTGRSDEEKQRTFESVNAIFLEHFSNVQKTKPIALSFELTELPEKLRHNANNIRDYL